MNACEILVQNLIQRNYMISAAESCTRGLFASRIVSIPDASKVLSASFVTYSEQAKNKFAFVPFDTIEKFGVVSEETAIAMARGAAENAGAQVGVGITGYAGPSGGDKFAPKGTVCFGFFINGEEHTERIFIADKTRNMIREFSVRFAIKKLNELLE